ncbi:MULTISPECIES: hypothetical protein [Acinetobacter]|jgi:hypothetical protein|uniref:hypothetical protein n=1 Tax=Acinetobacter TaxID=469 RepID=UPI001447BBE7|nr:MULTISPECIES: hypothetical protein [Acinetobacter]MBF4520398.1 hypothetical protein [Acinetobacter towneri]MDM1487625.1 hypothetical protein [Acinetobacter towneri]MEB6564647.1 hypothetical protein [Acinetobacter towneri]NLN57092.1 hypothetical protein [Gammaproteobacteria bacterium]
MKKIYLMTAFVLCSTFAIANENTSTIDATKLATVQTAQSVQNTNKFRVVTRPEIVGLWGMQIPNNRKCIEYYNFKSNNDVIIKSGQEWSAGVYDYQPSQDPANLLPALILQIKYDNNEVDCSGHQEDQTGDISQYFVKWKNAHTINFCSNEKAEQCFATLYRVLP